MTLKPKLGAKATRINEIKHKIYNNRFSSSVSGLTDILPGALWFLGTYLFGSLVFSDSWATGRTGTLLFLCALVPAILIIVFRIKKVPQTPWDSLLKELDQIADARATALLLDLMSHPNHPRYPGSSYHEMIRASLTHKLPELQRVDAVFLSNEHRMLLYEEMQSADAPLMLAILQTIERMTWVNALPHIAGLAKGEGVAKRNSAVHEAAQSCEQTLQLVVNQLEAPQTLLRASAPAASPGELLRAADSTRSTPEADAQLLRPTLGQEETAVQ